MLDSPSYREAIVREPARATANKASAASPRSCRAIKWLFDCAENNQRGHIAIQR